MFDQLRPGAVATAISMVTGPGGSGWAPRSAWLCLMKEKLPALIAFGNMATTFRHGGHVTQATVIVALDIETEDSDEHLARLTRELEGDLRDVGEVRYLTLPATADSKGVGEVVAATLAVVTGADPVYVQALVETVVAFLRRNEGRRARLTVGDVEVAIDQPTRDEVADLIEIARVAIERAAGEAAEG